MFDSPVDEIKNRLDIVEVISGYIQVQKAGANFRARCPFHNEKTPSFMVSPSRQIWHCFGCGAGGDIFGFVMKMENLEFPEALKILAGRAGIELKKEDPKLRSERTRNYDICEAAVKFFDYCLWEKDFGKPVLDYLRQRGLVDETIKEFRIGFAPHSWDSLLNFLFKRGYKEAEIEKTGLIIKGENRTAGRQHYDRFRSRIMFPICNISGQPVGFSGRIFHLRPSGYGGQVKGREDEAKYVNTPNTLLYDKSKILYGLDKSRNEIRRQDACFLVEGQMDMIMSWQDGVQNVCATSGTALTAEHLNLLKRSTQNLILGFDMDEAGENATARGIDLAMASGFNIKVTSLSEGKDPADFVKEHPGQLKPVLEKGQGIMDFYFERTFQKYDPRALEDKKKIGAVLLPQIRKIYNKIEQAHWLEELARRLGVAADVLKDEMKKIKAGHLSADEFLPAAAAARPRTEMVAERLLALTLCKPECISFLSELEVSVPSRMAPICEGLKAVGGNFSFENFYQNLPVDLRETVDHLMLKADYEVELSPSINFQKEIAKAVYELNLQKVSDDLKQAETDLNKGGESGEIMSRMYGLMSKKQNLIKKFSQTV